MRKLLFDRNSSVLQPLLDLIILQKHRTLVLWTIDCSARILPIFEEKYSLDFRPRNAVKAAKDWASGKIKMPEAKAAALAAHIAATDVKDDFAAAAAARAMGHVVGTVHVETHAIGVIMYGLTAMVHRGNFDIFDELVKKECQWFYKRLQYWKKNIDTIKRPWAAFLLRENVENKELLLRKKAAQIKHK